MEKKYNFLDGPYLVYHTTLDIQRTFASVFGGDEVKSVSVTEGDSVTLNTDLSEILKEEISWRFGNNRVLIAKLYGKHNESRIYDDNADGRFVGRLKLDHQTGSLTITNTRTTDDGLYKVTNSSRVTPLNTFNLTVYARLPVPVISSNSSQNSSSSSGSLVSRCVLLCSVVNVGHVTLSWYKGNSLLSSISVSDLSISLSLPLEIECLDDSYSCVLNNPISHQTTHLNNTQLCQPCSDYIHCCGSTEAVIRLALSALVGVAAFAVLVYDIRSRSLLQKMREQTSF
ncbi:SLAM family member 9-like [Sinocyclocheilus rhinocerous]|uniref:SLAM family member 9-like n=1 Tax=Sinocyclocheilus rhinocerous TaxID=307959 RepID=UPI0007BA6BC7|nr:PREDICTED: SLAM family member 9-like [Sinocyclocheilus rhinocerous]